MDSQNTRQVSIDDILAEDNTGHRSHFLEQIRIQYLSEIVFFEKHVLDAIDQFADLNEKELSISKYREALIYADPNKTRSEINQWLARACACSIEEMLLSEAKRTMYSVSEFKRNLCSALLKKSAPTSRVK